MIPTATCELQVNLTQEHIDKGYRGSCSCCPVALAVEQAALTHHVVAQEEFIHWRHPEIPRWYMARTPRAVNKFMAAFDRGQGVRPLSFNLVGALLEEGQRP